MRVAIVFYNDHHKESFERVLWKVSEPLAKWFRRTRDDDDDNEEEENSNKVQVPANELLCGIEGKEYPVYTRPASLQRPGLEILLVWTMSKRWDYAEAIDVLTGGVEAQRHLVADRVVVIYSSYAYEVHHCLNGRDVYGCASWREFASCVPPEYRTSEFDAIWAAVWNSFVESPKHKRIPKTIVY